MWMQSRKLTVITIIALFIAITLVPKMSAEEALETSVADSSMVSDNRFRIEDIQFILDSAIDLIEALFTVTLSKEDAIDLFTTIAMIVELVAGMIFAAFPLAFIAYIVIMLSIFLPPVLITGMVWDIFALLIILYGGIFVGLMATAMLDNVTGLSGLIGGVLSRMYFALTPLVL
jgi:hypothetical protein